eukprot:Gregarina_sp_Pseudo_9__4499@NODE_466_length_2775_cov_6_878289_g442_i0_p1_GENE_NODE_466_length_2775_cov_6_878289_g442_i0NODE_466_length_2775_cov_6_878289_g442_i0_p1_ORF_typecomplete_len822_score182_09RHD3/PF05879_12/1_6e77GBP/PF02263_19/7_3e09GBP/PF02263_19/3_2e02Dynamin_N/PF00350_23/0_00017Dynamin_N/PF00350_23/2_5e03MMR_HSR1/PF01926_23/0_00016AIG1/PF04548_16/0_006Septin/PF00735_18/0_0093ABC_tran/PF00005_27/0_074ABC_tran/PF00005_27/1_9e03IIGP/PF05049_13/0_028AAA_15/PF13175_6/0_031Roc/PF08477_13/0
MTEIGVATLSRRRSSLSSAGKHPSNSPPQVKPSTGNSLVQIIDFDGTFARDFENHLSRLGISRCGFKFNVITVLGCQSSGKSTLLNSLFGTTFPEMDSMEGRSQTTKGVWVAKDVSSNTLVVDVEGTDSRERGENRLTFEHRASLFSLAIADAVIVNMWYQDLGRYAASNYGLLKTVFAVNLELFQQEANTKKTTLIFVIREYSHRVTPLAKLNEMLLKDIYEIWDDIKKPVDMARSKASDFFKFVVIGMPSKLTDPDGYLREVQSLRKRWLEEEAPATYSRNVPADGFAFYARAVWDAILNSSELDIPSQKEMVATYRCEEIRQATLSEIIPRIAAASVDPTRLFDERIAENAIRDAIEMYHRDAWRYQENIYNKKKEQLLESLYNEIQRPLEKFLYATRQRLVKERSRDLEKLCKRDEWDSSLMADGRSVMEFWEGLRGMLCDWRSEIMTDFDEICGQASVNCVVEIEDHAQPIRHEIKHVFETELVRKTLEEALDETVNKIMTKETAGFKEYLSSKVDELRTEVEVLYNEPVVSKETFWPPVQDLCRTKIDSYWDAFGKALEGIDLETDSDRQLQPRDRLALMTVLLLKDALSKRVEWLPELIHKRFLKYFESDDKGVPYYWASLSQEKIRNIYLGAREKAETLLPTISTFDLEITSLLSANLELTESETRALRMPIVPSESKRADVAAQAAKRMLKSCQEAQFVQATGGKVSTPAWWWWGLLVILGWNEFMAIINHPFFVVVLLAALCVAAATYYTGNIFLVVNTARNFSSLVLGFVIPILTSLQEGGSSVRTVRPADEKEDE